jgi:glycosyltransferase involved in cell wall biosynthesis
VIRDIVFNTWSGAFFNVGGGEIQLAHSKAGLEKLGYEVHRFNQWHPRTDTDLLHQFSIAPGVEHVIEGYRSLGIPVALSTIMWEIPPREHFLYNHIQHLLNVADLLFTNSNMESRRLADEFSVDENKFHKTRNGITADYFTLETDEDFREAYGIQGDFILSVANIDRRKNTERLLEACEQLGQQVVLVGHIRDQEYYESFRGRFSNYHYVGPISDIPTLKSAYQQCLLYALPSTCETPGIAAMEAASQGARIVITDEGSTSEYFEDRVTYVNPFDTDAIVAGIESELGADPRSGLRDLVISNYTWDKAAEDIRQGYLMLDIGM